MTDCRELSSNGGNGPALGLFDDAQDRTCECPMAGNDFIMLFTDGLFEVEAPDDKIYSRERCPNGSGCQRLNCFLNFLARSDSSPTALISQMMYASLA